MQQTQRIAFIGAGNMASAIIQGLVKQGWPADQIIAANPSKEKLTTLAQQLHIQTTTDNIQAVQQADVICLAVKPQVLPMVLPEINDAVRQHKPLVISVAAGFKLAAIMAVLGDDIACVRAMPNTPAIVGLSATTLYANLQVSDAQQQAASQIFNAVGTTAWLADETLLDVATAVCGSGPAYVFYFMQALIDAAVLRGLPDNLSKELVQQTLLGSVQLACQSEASLNELRRNITSPGGTTAAGVAVLEDAGLNQLMDDVVASATARAKALGQ